MNDPSGVQPALGVESVEWFASGGSRITVRVTGRWMRRPATAHEQPSGSPIGDPGPEAGVDAALADLANAEARVSELEQETAELRRRAEDTGGVAGQWARGGPLNWVAEPLRQEADLARGAGLAPEP